MKNGHDGAGNQVKRYVYRHITQRLEELTNAFPVVVVTGARQVGKSTLLRETIGKNAETVVFDPVIDVENARRDPELFLNTHKTPLILDEIQYAPELVSAIKRRVDNNKKPGQYVITGSQAWGVIKSISESLAGRAVLIDMGSFSLYETVEIEKDKLWLNKWLDNNEEFLNAGHTIVEPKYDLYEQIWRGFLPDAQFLPLNVIPDFISSYIRTYIERDVRLLADVSDLQLFGRFFKLVSALTAQEINFAQLGREIGISPKTSQRWLDILKATFQWFEIPAFSMNAVKKLSGKPKGYISDSGITCFSQAISSPKAIANSPLVGHLYESVVVNELRKQSSLMKVPANMYHWRAHTGAEVDILLERDNKYYPIEIKSKSLPSRVDTSGIKALRATYPGLNIQKGLVIAPAEKIVQISDYDYVLPWNVV